MNEQDKINGLVKFISEIQMLKRIDHEGMRLAGVTPTDTVGEHVALSAQIAYILGEMEGVDAAKCAVINLFHDNHEARIGDHHKVSARYLETKSAEKEAEAEHLANLPEPLASRIQSLLNERWDRTTPEGIIAQDADWLEVAFEAKVQTERGFIGCAVWIDNVERALETESAKRILEAVKNTDDFTNTWWQGLKKMTYDKLK